MKTKLWAIILVFFCTLLTSTAQVFYKFAVKDMRFDPISLATNYWLIGGLALYGLGALLLIIGLKGGELTVLYPIIATGYIWVCIYSVYFFGEIMSALKWLGVFSIIVGIAMIGYGSNKDEESGKAEREFIGV